MPVLTAAEFKRKWARYQGKETSAYQGHFDDLCRLLEQPTPVEADPTGSESFCYQKRVLKDRELFETPDSGDPTERGFADVWKKDCFGWEYKGKKKNLDEAYRQLLRYREALLNPPLLVVCDFDRYIIRTNFNGTVQETYQFTNDQIDEPKNWRILRALFENPDSLKPQRSTEQVTKDLAATIAEVARSLQDRECVELADAASRKEVKVAQKKNLRIARFLNRIVFCLFAEDTALLPPRLFSEVVKTGLEDPRLFAASLEDLFRKMAKGGRFGAKNIRHFNGHLFEESTVFELREDEIRKLADAAKADWQFIQPSIMGTLFERAMDESQRAQLGAHYTGEVDIRDLVEPVLMAPLRREWQALKVSLLPSRGRGKGTAGDRDRIEKFLTKLRSIVVLDPACGSGNFLYVSLQLLLDLEKEVITLAVQLGFQFTPEVSVQQLRAIEINPYAYELAQVTVQIGYLQWRRDNGFDNDRTPVLQNLDGFQYEDALLLPHYRGKAKTLAGAQAGEHKDNTALIFYTEREWPETDVIVSNPPFLGDKLMRGELGDYYVEQLRRTYGDRIPGQSDLCCYWFEKARNLIENGKCKRAGLLATQAIRGGASREVLRRIKHSGDIFFAESDREWILAGANVHVSMVGFDSGIEIHRILDGRPVSEIGPQLTEEKTASEIGPLRQNAGVSFMGVTPSGPFIVGIQATMEWLNAPNAHGKPNSDVLRPWFNGSDITSRSSESWIVDFSAISSEQEAALFEGPFAYVRKAVQEARKGYKTGGRLFWKFERSRPEMRSALEAHTRYVGRSMVAKHQFYVWFPACILPANLVIIFARADDYFFGVLHSCFHGVWALKLGTRLETRPRYTPTTCFETFPFPRPVPMQETKIGTAAEELNDLRERWLNPPEWTAESILEFPGSVNGPWSRYVVNPDKNGVGTVRYPRLAPRDANCAAKLKKRTLTNLYNERPAWLDLAHKKLDTVVAAAYGWPTDLTDEQILERLLALNLERAIEEEIAARAEREKRFVPLTAPMTPQVAPPPVVEPGAAHKPKRRRKRVS